VGFDLPGFRNATSFLREISERDPVMEEFSESSVRFRRISTDPEDAQFPMGFSDCPSPLENFQREFSQPIDLLVGQ
jgi:hypothetical protein